jgi:NDP-sugar pyrophosphorylase family protein
MKNKTNFVFPIAGAGSRFKVNGFENPKPLMEIQGHFFFEIAAKALLRDVNDYTISFLVLRQHIQEFEIERKIRRVFPNADIAVIDELTMGAAETTFIGLKQLHLGHGSLIVADCDQWIRGRSLVAMFNGLCSGLVDIAIPVFKSDDPGYSYVTRDSDGRILKIVEKEPTSGIAVAGCYGFKTSELFQKMYLKTHIWGKEKYLSSIVAQGVVENCNVKGFDLDTHVPFGTPVEYEKAVQNSNLIGEISDW